MLSQPKGDHVGVPVSEAVLYDKSLHRVMHSRVLAVAMVVLIAGCGAVPFGDGGQPAPPTDTVTPVPISADGTETTTGTPAALPPGVDTDGSVNAQRLSEAHENYVENRSYTWFIEYDTGNDGFVGGVFVRRAVVGEGTFYVEQISPGPSPNSTLYVNETAGFLRTIDGNETRYELLDVPGEHTEYVFAGNAVRRFLTGPQFTVTSVDRGGQTYYRLHTVDGTVPRRLSESSGVVSNYTATAYVTPEGFVKSLSVEYDRRIDRNHSQVTFRYDYSELGESSPTVPEWVGSVPQRSTPTPSSIETSTSSNATVTPTSRASPTPTPTKTSAPDEG